MTDCRYMLCLESLVGVESTLWTLLVFKAWNRLLILDPSVASVRPHILGVTSYRKCST